MKKFILMFSLAILSVFFTANNAFGQIGLGFLAGFSTPNDKINDVYNSKNFDWGNNNIGSIIRNGAKTGYHFGIKARMPLAGGLSFTGSIAYNKFPDTKLEITNPNDPTNKVSLTTSQDIIPVAAGINYHIIRSVIGVYGLGELTYNYISNSVNVDTKGVDIPISSSPSYNRVGANVGAGIDFDLFLVNMNVEAKYNFTNLIGKETGESTKSFFSLSLGVYFGKVK